MDPLYDEINTLIKIYNLGDTTKTEQACRKLLTVYPSSYIVFNILGATLCGSGKFKEAISAYDKVIKLNPGFAVAYSNRGDILRKLGQPEDAIKSCDIAINLNPNFAEAYCNRGVALQGLGHPREAVKNYDKAIQLKPDYPIAFYNLGNVLQGLGHPREAVKNYDKAIQLKPDFAEAYSNRGAALQDLGRLGEAVKSYKQASIIDIRYVFNAKFVLPIIPLSRGNIDHWRNSYQTGIKSLSSQSIEIDNINNIGINSFYLAYHNRDNRSVMEELCNLFKSKISNLTYTSPHISNWSFPIKHAGKIRIGFLSKFFSEHTIGRHYQGFLKHLDRTRFEIVMIHAYETKYDAFREHLDALVDKVINLPRSLFSQQEIVAGEALDVLFYPDIGMSKETYFLAYSRLAPVQLVSWGHPDTTGLDTMDYYLSANIIESAQSDTYYSERLIRLNHLPCFYQPLSAPKKIQTRSAFGLPEVGVLYGCPQSLFKLHPDFDSVLAKIVTDDPQGHIVLIEPKVLAWSQLLRERWATTYPILLDRVVFLPRQPIDSFMALMAHFDILLDPIYFGSGDTMYAAMVYGKPIVTWPGRFARGRVVAGAYRQMKILDAPIAEQVEDYAALAVELGLDEKRRHALIQDTLQKVQFLFNDKVAVQEFEDFVHDAVTATGQGKMLSESWRPLSHKK